METVAAVTALQWHERRGFAALHRDVWRIVRAKPAFFLGLPALMMLLPDLAIEIVAAELSLGTFQEFRFYTTAGFWEALLVGSLVWSIHLAGLANLRREGRIPIAASFKEGVANWGRMMNTYWSATWRISLALLLLIVPGLYLWIRYSLALPAAFFEQSRGPAALDASAERVKGRSWKILFLIAGALLLYVPAMVATSVLLPFSAGPIWVTIAYIPANMILALLLVALTLLYFDGETRDTDSETGAEERFSSTAPLAAAPSGRAGVVLATFLSYGALTTAVFLFVHLATAPIVRGDEAYELGNYDTALDEYSIALYWDPEDPYVHYSLAYVYQELDRPADAIASMRAALDLDPNDPGLNEAMVALFLSERMPDAARRHVENAYGAGFIVDEQRAELEIWIEDYEAEEAKLKA